MIYKNFEENITRKHGVVIEGWPLHKFDNPSAIGSQVELKVLLNAWQSGATRFRKMKVDEHIAWMEARAVLHDDSQTPATHPPNPTPILLPPLSTQEGDLGLTPAINPTSSHTSFIHFESPATPAVSAGSTPSRSKKPRKTQSDKGKPRRRTTQIPGENVFSASMP